MAELIHKETFSFNDNGKVVNGFPATLHIKLHRNVAGPPFSFQIMLSTSVESGWHPESVAFSFSAAVDDSCNNIEIVNVEPKSETQAKSNAVHDHKSGMTVVSSLSSNANAGTSLTRSASSSTAVAMTKNPSWTISLRRETEKVIWVLRNDASPAPATLDEFAFVVQAGVQGATATVHSLHLKCEFETEVQKLCPLHISSHTLKTVITKSFTIINEVDSRHAAASVQPQRSDRVISRVSAGSMSTGEAGRSSVLSPVAEQQSSDSLTDSIVSLSFASVNSAADMHVPMPTFSNLSLEDWMAATDPVSEIKAFLIRNKDVWKTSHEIEGALRSLPADMSVRQRKTEVNRIILRLQGVLEGSYLFEYQPAAESYASCRAVSQRK